MEGSAPEPSASPAPSPTPPDARHLKRRQISRRTTARLSDSAAETWENELRGRLGLTPLGWRESPTERRRGWILTGVIALVAAIARLFRLSHPHELIFDETYYVKEAFSFLRQGFEGAWAENINDAFISGDYSGLSATEAEYVVHPPLGKWIMALGQAVFGSEAGLGWRFSTAVIGVLAVVLVVRIALRMFRSPLLAGLAGLAIALDGMGIVMSRTGILDNILAFFILAGFWAIVRDREHSRSRLAHAVAHGYLDAEGSPQDVWGPRLFYRPWLIVAGLLLGMSTGVKWSGIYAIAVFGLLVALWGLLARRAVGARLFVGAGVFREGLPAFVQLVPVAGVTYVACWLSWFINPKSWGRDWAATTDEPLPISWAPDAVNSWLHYHSQMWDFHNGLETPHTYQSKPWVWIVQGRPVSFYWKGTEEMADSCAGSDCVQAITSVGNIAVWWIGLLALVSVIVVGIRRRDWRAGAIAAGYVATYLPWFMYAHRTIFQFYAIALLPFVAFALAWAAGAVSGMLGAPYAPSRPISDVLAGVEGAWTAGVARGVGKKAQLDEEQVFEDFPAPAPAGSDDAVSEAADEAASDGATGDVVDDMTSELTSDVAGEAEQEAPAEAGATDEAAADERNIYARIFGAFFGQATQKESDQWWEAAPTTLGLTLVTATSILIVVAAVFWYPLWIGSTVSYDFWHAHMFFDSWI